MKSYRDYLLVAGKSCRACWLIAIWLIAVWLITGQLGAQEPLERFVLERRSQLSADQQFVGAMRDRGLYALGREYCQSRLQDDRLAMEAQTGLAVEWIKLEVAEAIAAERSAQEAAWQRPVETARRFIVDWRGKPRVILVELQDALTPLARGSRINREFLARDGQLPDGEIQIGLAALRQSIDKLREVQQHAAQLKAELSRESGTGSESLNLAQLDSLQKSVLQYLAEANLRRAQFFAVEDRANRIDALNQVLLQVGELESQLNNQHPLWIPTRLLRARCERLLGDQRAATRTLGDLQIDRQPDSGAAVSGRDAQSWMREAIELALVTGQLEPWLERLSGILQAEVYPCHDEPELDLAVVRLCLAHSRQQDSRGAAAWQERAVAIAERITARHGRYWGRMADLQLVDVARSTSGSSSFGMLNRLAEQYIEKGQFAQALETLDTAASVAVENQQFDLALQAGLRQGQILQRQTGPGAAADHMRMAALQFSDQTEAASVHLLACWNQAMVLQDNKLNSAQRTEGLAAYRNLLREHLLTWQSRKTSAQARLWAGQAAAAAGEAGEASLHFLIVATAAECEPVFRVKALNGLVDHLLQGLASVNRNDSPADSLGGSQSEQDLFAGLSLSIPKSLAARLETVLEQPAVSQDAVAVRLVLAARTEMALAPWVQSRLANQDANSRSERAETIANRAGGMVAAMGCAAGCQQRNAASGTGGQPGVSILEPGARCGGGGDRKRKSSWARGDAGTGTEFR